MNHRLRAFLLACGVFLADRLSKLWIEARVSVEETHTVIPGFFDIVHTRNRGAAFGMFSDSPDGWRAFFLLGVSAAALVLIAGMLWRASRLDRATRVGLALIFGGASGNIFDRLATGTVTDFLDFYLGSLHWPAFNLADSAIVIGCGLLLLEMVKPKRQPGTNWNAS
ncbi:MAG: signal peptidase II [Bryobacterales bacterium]|nr:signal peptidase II [Bryobacterales bacterium]